MVLTCGQKDAMMFPQSIALVTVAHEIVSEHRTYVAAYRCVVQCCTKEHQGTHFLHLDDK